MTDCLFCKIAKKEIPSEFLYETDDFFVIKDINPKAPIHLLLIPKEHIESLNALEDEKLAGKLFLGIKETARHLGIKDYKTLIHTGAGAGQVIFHLHIHIMANGTLADC